MLSTSLLTIKTFRIVNVYCMLVDFFSFESLAPGDIPRC